MIDKQQRNPAFPNIFGVGVGVAIAPVSATPVPTGVPKTGFMIESMVTATAINIADLLQGAEPKAEATWNAVCLADFGDGGILDVNQWNKPDANFPLSQLQPPTVFRDKLLLGWASKDWHDAANPLGSVFAVDARTGELDWTFGFKIPRSPPSNGHSETPVPGPERRPPPPKQEFEGPEPSEKELEQEHTLLARARMALSGQPLDGSGKKWLHSLSSKKEDGPAFPRIRDAVEAWNLADTETWKFVRAFGARKAMEKAKWEEEEQRYLEKGMVGRWVDKVI